MKARVMIILVAALLVCITASCVSKVQNVSSDFIDIVTYGSPDEVTKLIEKGVDINARDTEGLTPLHYALRARRAEIVHILVSHGAQRDIYTASALGDTNCVQELLSKGQNPNKPDSFGEAPLHWAARAGKASVIEMLLTHGAKADARDAFANGVTALHIASANGDIEAINLLLKAGSNVNKKSWLGETPIVNSLNCHRIEVFRYLLAKGAHIKITDSRGNTLLHKAVSFKWPEVIPELVRRGVGVNTRNRSGDTPLCFASSDPMFENCATVLVREGANVNALGATGYSALQTAVREHEFRLAKIMLEKRGVEDIFVASALGHYSVVDRLIKSGVSPNVRDVAGYTPLHWASSNSSTKVILLLLSKGASPNAVNSFGYSPLHVAVGAWGNGMDNRNQRLAAARLLIEHGASPTIKAKSGYTPVDIAKRIGIDL